MDRQDFNLGDSTEDFKKFSVDQYIEKGEELKN
jgi:hypothetical protein